MILKPGSPAAESAGLPAPKTVVKMVRLRTRKEIIAAAKAALDDYYRGTPEALWDKADDIVEDLLGLLGETYVPPGTPTGPPGPPK